MPTPTAEEINSVRKIVGGISYQAAASLIDALEAVEWTQAQTYVEEWAKVEFDNTELQNSILGANISPKAQRLLIRNAMRDLLGLPSVSSFESTGEVEAITSLAWF